MLRSLLAGVGYWSGLSVKQLRARLLRRPFHKCILGRGTSVLAWLREKESGIVPRSKCKYRFRLSCSKVEALNFPSFARVFKMALKL